MSDSIIDHYEAAAEKVALAIRNLTPEDMLCVPDATANVGKWSIQQVVIHLADAEAAFADRIRRMIAEENPILYAWNENLFAANLHYDQQCPQDAVDIIRLIRRQTSRILHAAGKPALSRKGNHSERGPMTVGEVVEMSTSHLNHHVKFIHDKRAQMGKEMW
jgi:uncharacterized damage-inducible protein DinB